MAHRMAASKRDKEDGRGRVVARRRKLRRSVAAVALVLLAAGQARAQALVLYDDFSEALLDPDKWVTGQGGNHVMESIRQIEASGLRLEARGYGETASDVGITFQGPSLGFVNPTAVTAVQSTVIVTDASATACPSNPGFTAAQLTIHGSFFNAGTPIPGTNQDDVYGAVYLGRQPADPPDTVNVYFSVFRCVDAFCNSVTLGGGSLGSATLGQSVVLLLQWDQPNQQFIFQRDSGPPQTVPYTVSDTAPPGLPQKYILIANAVPNCTTARPALFMNAVVENVLVNQ